MDGTQRDEVSRSAVVRPCAMGGGTAIWPSGDPRMPHRSVKTTKKCCASKINDPDMGVCAEIGGSDKTLCEIKHFVGNGLVRCPNLGHTWVPRCRLEGRRIGKPVKLRRCPRNGKDGGCGNSHWANRAWEGVASERARQARKPAMDERQTAGGGGDGCHGPVALQSPERSLPHPARGVAGE